MSKFLINVDHIPTVTLYYISANEFESKLKATWNWTSIDIEDTGYFYPKWEDWDKIFQYVQKSLPTYVPNKFDCDNFAYYVSVMVSSKFGCNTCNVVEGYVDFRDGRGFQRHKWNVFFDGGNFYQLESQKKTPPNEIADLDDPYYIPDEIIAF